MSLRPLTPLEQRIVGVLFEKQHTVPDSYPLSLNALQAGCNQKTAREPVMQASETELLTALDALKALHLVVEIGGSRVTRYEHNLPRVLRVPSQAAALLATLMLRGPQTSAELRAAAERLHRFADVSSVEAFLEELAARPDEQGGALVTKAPRAAGEREQRWMQRLGEATPAPPSAAHARAAADPANAARDDELAALRAHQMHLQREVALLRAQLQRLAARLGVDDFA